MTWRAMIYDVRWRMTCDDMTGDDIWHAKTCDVRGCMTCEHVLPAHTFGVAHVWRGKTYGMWRRMVCAEVTCLLLIWFAVNSTEAKWNQIRQLKKKYDSSNWILSYLVDWLAICGYAIRSLHWFTVPCTSNWENTCKIDFLLNLFNNNIATVYNLR